MPGDPPEVRNFSLDLSKMAPAGIAHSFMVGESKILMIAYLFPEPFQEWHAVSQLAAAPENRSRLRHETNHWSYLGEGDRTIIFFGNPAQAAILDQQMRANGGQQVAPMEALERSEDLTPFIRGANGKARGGIKGIAAGESVVAFSSNSERGQIEDIRPPLTVA